MQIIVYGSVLQTGGREEAQWGSREILNFGFLEITMILEEK